MSFLNFQSPLREGFVRPPNAMDGIPAPISRYTNLDDAMIAKQIVWATLFNDFTADVDDFSSSSFWTDDMTW